MKPIQEPDSISEKGLFQNPEKADTAYFLDDFQTDQKKDTMNWRRVLKKAAKERAANSDVN